MNEVKQYSNRMVLMRDGKAHEINELGKKFFVVVYNKQLPGFRPFFQNCQKVVDAIELEQLKTQLEQEVYTIEDVSIE